MTPVRTHSVYLEDSIVVSDSIDVSEVRFNPPIRLVDETEYDDRWATLDEIKVVIHRREKSKSPPRGALTALEALRWFFDAANRDHIDLALADLKKDVRDMQRGGRRSWFIHLVLVCQVTQTLVPILWDRVVRITKAILLIASIVRRFKGPF